MSDLFAELLLLDLDARREFYTPAAWKMGHAAYMQIRAASIAKHSGYAFAPALRQQESLFGIDIVIDPKLPRNRVELRDAEGRLVGQIDNIG